MTTTEEKRDAIEEAIVAKVNFPEITYQNTFVAAQQARFSAEGSLILFEMQIDSGVQPNY